MMRNQLETVTGPVHTVTYSYEPGRNAMTNIENNRTVGGTGVISNYAYTYNALGQRTERAQSGSAITSSADTFSYDSLGQVTGSTNSVETTADKWNPNYNFDMIGNRAGATVDINGSKDYTANLLNQYTTISDVPTSTSKLPINDKDGNLTSDGGSWYYTWNGENRLINADNGTVSIDFEYDYQGRLVRKDDGTNIVVYLYDGWNRIAKYQLHTSSFTLHNSNLWGLDMSGSMQGAGGVGGLLKEGNLYPTFDANGNIMQKLSSTGNVDMNVAYDPFGNIISGTLVGEYGFSTKPLVGGIQWYCYGFRYYDPVMGRWPSRDPIGELGGLNVYGFVWNDGVNLVDVLGLRGGGKPLEFFRDPNRARDFFDGDVADRWARGSAPSVDSTLLLPVPRSQGGADEPNTEFTGRQYWIVRPEQPPESMPGSGDLNSMGCPDVDGSWPGFPAGSTRTRVRDLGVRVRGELKCCEDTTVHEFQVEICRKLTRGEIEARGLVDQPGGRLTEPPFEWVYPPDGGLSHRCMKPQSEE